LWSHLLVSIGVAHSNPHLQEHEASP
jgi:hypothetical protein